MSATCPRMRASDSALMMGQDHFVIALVLPRPVRGSWLDYRDNPFLDQARQARVAEPWRHGDHRTPGNGRAARSQRRAVASKNRVVAIPVR
jgi:hypothetical protein